MQVQFNKKACKACEMKEKKKGFTLIEVIVVLAITVMIACVIYTFYNSNNRTLTNAEAKSTLQLEGSQIQKDLLNYGTQAKSIDVQGDIDDASKITFTVCENDDLDSSNPTNYIFELSNRHDMRGTTVSDMKIYKDGTDVSKIDPRSTHVKSIQLKNLDSASVTNINNASSVQVTVNLYIKKGLNEVEYPVTTIVKLRNKNVN